MPLSTATADASRGHDARAQGACHEGPAVRAVLHEPRYRQAAQRVAASMRAAGGMGQLAAVIDGLAGQATIGRP